MAAGIDETGWHDGALEIGLDRLGSFLEKLQEEASVFFRRIRRRQEKVVSGFSFGERNRQREEGNEEQVGVVIERIARTTSFFCFSAASGARSDSFFCCTQSEEEE
jgi:hypothetical protein